VQALAVDQLPPRGYDIVFHQAGFLSGLVFPAFLETWGVTCRRFAQKLLSKPALIFVVEERLVLQIGLPGGAITFRHTKTGHQTPPVTKNRNCRAGPVDLAPTRRRHRPIAPGIAISSTQAPRQTDG